MKKITLVVLALYFGSTHLLFAQQIEFSPVSNMEMLIANIFGVQCDGVSNVTHSQAPQALGRFENGGVIGLNSGLVLSTGLVSNAGQNSNIFNSFGPWAGGDADINLYGMLNGLPSTSYDACFVEFDFTPSVSDTISFTYILASEEYPEYSNTQYTDRFMFLVSENGGASTNIAIIPGTTTTVEINSVNQLVNSQYYIDNLNGGNPAFNFFVYDGYTTPFIAKFYAQVGSSYHIKLVIADISDEIYDSSIFLEEQESYNDISGNLSVNGTPAEGLLEIFNFVGDTLLAQPAYSTIVSNGSYLADSLSTGMYHVRFTPDPILFPGSSPLYFTNGETWNTAQEIGLPCFLENGNINSTTLNGLSGDASISGVINIDTSYTKVSTEPFEGALIKLFNAQDEVVAFTYSDAMGMYSFQNVETGNYYLLIDVPYIPQLDVHEITITGDEIYLGADFSILTDGIFAEDNLILGTEESLNFAANIYPNPAKEQLTILHSSNESIEYTLYTLNGSVATAGIASIGKHIIDLSTIESGIYILQLGDSKREKVVITK